MDEDRFERSLKSIGDAYVREHPPNYPAFREAVLKRRRRRTWIQLGSAVAFAGAAVAIGLFLTRAQPQLSRSIPPAGDEAITDTVQVGRFPSQINVGRNAIWVTSRVPGQLTHIDPVTKEPTTVGLGGVPNDLAVGGTGVWIANAGDLQHVPLEGTGHEDFSVASLGATMHVAVSPGAVWVVVAGEAVFRVDPDSPKDMTRVPVTQNPVDIAVGEGTLWVLDSTGEIQAFDARSGEPTGRPVSVQTGENAEITLGGDALWYGVRGTTSLARIDTSTREQQRILLPSPYVDLGIGQDEVWVLMDGGADTGSLAPLDPSSGEVLSQGSTSLSGAPVDVAVGRKGLWVINTTGAVAQRIDKAALAE
jgi:hypothetical protein